MVLIMKKHFEDYLSFLENDLGYQFFDYQKTLLREIYEGKRYFYCTNRYADTHWLYDVMRRFKEEMDRGEGGLLPWMYKLDGYSTDIVVYDEDLKNIEWEKENRI